jgi:hypothetical protein
MIVKITKEGKVVSTQEHLIGKRQDHSLCWQNCVYFKPMTTVNCPIAQTLFEHNLINGIATAVWECPKYKEK